MSHNYSIKPINKVNQMKKQPTMKNPYTLECMVRGNWISRGTGEWMGEDVLNRQIKILFSSVNVQKIRFTKGDKVEIIERRS